MTFKEYLSDKKIESEAFKNAESELWNHFNDIFKVMHPKSFTVQKLNLINELRRKYPFTPQGQTEIVKPKPKRPIIRPKKQE